MIVFWQDSHKHMDEFADLEAEILRRMEAEDARNNKLRKQVRLGR